MKNKIVIPKRQFTVLITMCNIGTTILIIPYLLISDAKQDSWISVIITLLATIPIIYLHTKLYYLYPGNTLSGLIQIAFGKWVGKILAAMFLITFPLVVNGLTLRNVGDFLTTQIMPETPIEAIHIIVILVAIYAVHLGLEAITRVGELLIPISFFFLIIMFIILIPNIKFDFLFPIMEHGIRPVLNGSMTFLSFPFMEGVLYMMVMPFIREQHKIFKAYMTGIIVSWVVLSITTMMAVLVLGPFIASSEVFPSFTLAKSINLPEVAERVELTVATAWFITSFFRVCFFYYCIVAGLSELFRVNYNIWINLVVAAATVLVSLYISPNIGFLLNFDHTIWPIMTGSFGVALPMLLFVVLLIKRKRNKKSKKNTK